jgi:CheY-like chemotaxis protein
MTSASLLCIDDRPSALEVRRETLERRGYHVEVATTGSAALRILEETSVAAVLLEYKFEGMDAEAIACHIKRRFPAQPIILLSVYSEVPERVLWLVDEYVMKSEVPEGLVRIIERVTNLSPQAYQRNSEAQKFAVRAGEKSRPAREAA